MLQAANPELERCLVSTLFSTAGTVKVAVDRWRHRQRPTLTYTVERLGQANAVALVAESDGASVLVARYLGAQHILWSPDGIHCGHKVNELLCLLVRVCRRQTVIDVEQAHDGTILAVQQPQPQVCIRLHKTWLGQGGHQALIPGPWSLPQAVRRPPQPQLGTCSHATSAHG